MRKQRELAVSGRANTKIIVSLRSTAAHSATIAMSSGQMATIGKDMTQQEVIEAAIRKAVPSIKKQ